MFLLVAVNLLWGLDKFSLKSIELLLYIQLQSEEFHGIYILVLDVYAVCANNLVIAI